MLEKRKARLLLSVEDDVVAEVALGLRLDEGDEALVEHVERHAQLPVLFGRHGLRLGELR